MVKMIKLADNLSIPAEDYANQGNSFIGIRGSGKTYTGTKAAEQLLIAGIPIIAFDPSGVWKALRHGIDGNKGFPVVVAGGDDPDVELTESNAVDIVAIALEQGVSLIIDLQGPNTASKAVWQRIMSNCIVYLMENNKQYGLRHIFIEEAAEFVPQRVYPGGQFLYSQIERMARMGRNFALGFTLINQRAEEIAKAVFEICEMVVVHRQTGKNSLKAIKSWLDLRAQGDTGMLDTLPTLKDGEAWVVDFNRIIKVKILPKQTFHPNPKSGNVSVADRAPVDVTAFINRFRSEPEVLSKKDTLSALKAENIELRKALMAAKQTDYRPILAKIGEAAGRAAVAIDEITKLSMFDGAQLKPTEPPAHFTDGSDQLIVDRMIQRINPELFGASAGQTSPPDKKPSGMKISGGFKRMLQAVCMFYPNPITKQRLGTISGMSITSGTFGTYMGHLKREGLIEAVQGGFVALKYGLDNVGEFDKLPKKPQALVEFWCDIIGPGNGASRILRHLASMAPKYCTREEIGEAVGISSKSGTFGTYIGILKANDLVTFVPGKLKAADELY